MNFPWFRNHLSRRDVTEIKEKRKREERDYESRGKRKNVKSREKRNRERVMAHRGGEKMR